ncbi:MAG: hypothetical protein AB1758_09895 [Candidatus Eremiobacterota bacterium]
MIIDPSARLDPGRARKPLAAFAPSGQVDSLASGVPPLQLIRPVRFEDSPGKLGETGRSTAFYCVPAAGPGPVAFLCCPTPDCRPTQVYQLWITAPPGFRPSQWVDMIKDVDHLFGLEDDLVDTRFGPEGQFLTLRADLLDPAHPLREAREKLFFEVLDKAQTFGFSLSADPELGELLPRVQAECASRGIPLTLR